MFGELYEFNEDLILNLRYSREPLIKVAEKYKFIPQILSGSKVLDGKDGETISEYTVNLGKTDALSQIEYLNGRKQVLTRYRDESRTDYEKYGSLYVKIFFMVGVLAAILLA